MSDNGNGIVGYNWTTWFIRVGSDDGYAAARHACLGPPNGVPSQSMTLSDVNRAFSFNPSGFPWFQ